MTHLWADGDPISVSASDELPVASFTWQGQCHRVAGIAKRWRVDEGWWRHRVWREYFKLYTQTGLLAIIFHDLLTDYWYIQRLYD